MYSLYIEKNEGKWMGSANAIQAIHGKTRIQYLDLTTGQVRNELPVSTAGPSMNLNAGTLNIYGDVVTT